MQQKLIEIIPSTDFKEADKFLLENLFPNGISDHDTDVYRRDLSCKIYNEADKLLHDNKFLRKSKIKFEHRFSLDSYYRVMYALYHLNHKSDY